MASKKCRSCGSPLLDGQTECEYCGAKGSILYGASYDAGASTDGANTDGLLDGYDLNNPLTFFEGTSAVSAEYGSPETYHDELEILNRIRDAYELYIPGGNVKPLRDAFLLFGIVKGRSYLNNRSSDGSLQCASAEFHYWKAIIYLELARAAKFDSLEKEIFADLTDIIDSFPDYCAMCWYYRCEAYKYFYPADFRNALTDINKAIKSKPNNAQFIKARWEVYVLQGDKDKALADLSKIKELNPKLGAECVERESKRQVIVSKKMGLFYTKTKRGKELKAISWFA